MSLIDRLRRSYVDHGTNYVQEAADEIERLTAEHQQHLAEIMRLNVLVESLTAEIDKNGELLRYVEGLETMNCARIRELQAKNSALADEVGDYIKENVVLTAELAETRSTGLHAVGEVARLTAERDALKSALQLIKANTNTIDWPDDINAAIQGAGK